ncbi:MAG TPA: lysophospholipid acyltransferase family protein [Solirubrobacteraceae bacterium]|nr:lysophospholipid acyltransferase family protein [Solirubrobacteraceae bacterium]
MAEIKPQVYVDPRPPEELAPFHEWARTHEPGWTYAAIRVLLTPVALALYRTRAMGAGNVPAGGAFILAPNHFSNLDHFFCCVYLRRRIRFMSKSQFFGNNPVLSYVFRVSGHFPVRRGHNDEEAFVTAHSVLARGGAVGIYAEGGRSRSGGLGEPRPGIGASRSSPGCQSSPWRSTAPRASADGATDTFPESGSAMGNRCASSAVRIRTATPSWRRPDRSSTA